MEPTSQNMPDYRKRNIFIVVAVVIAGLLTALILYFVFQKPQNTGQTSHEAKSLFYDTLGNAAKQQKLKVSMYRETFANKADADAHRNVGSIASSVSEVDTAGSAYRSVYAHNLLQEDKSFSVGRCIDNVTYNDVYQPPAQNTERAKTLKEAAERLTLIPNGNLFKVTQALTFIPCPRLGLLPASPPLAVARLSDGVFPVTLSETQAANWQKQLEGAALFDVTDEGTVEKDGKSLRKLSFKPKTGQVNQELYKIFYEAGEIAKIKAEVPNAEVDYEFQSINLNNTGGVGGFYLIDETTKLPAYSELYSTNPDKVTDSSPVAGRNIARTKQNYSYPEQLSITLETPLEFLE